jgi:hypothetical protein
MLGEEIDNQLNVIKKPFEINWDMLNSEFDSEKNKGRREKHRKTHDKEEKKLIFNKWCENFAPFLKPEVKTPKLA